MNAMNLAVAVAAAAILAVATSALTAAASEGRHGEGHHDHAEEAGHHRTDPGAGARAARDRLDPTYAKECGACHLAYPPSMLPAASWRALLGGLDHHFGQDAGLDDATRARLEAWLAARAAPSRAGTDAAPRRITALPWFVEEHREVPAGAVARPSIRTLANCAACHQGAAQWDFGEDRVRIPQG